MCAVIQMGPWTSVLSIKVSLLVECPDFNMYAHGQVSLLVIKF